jgi:hypothetical protein
MKNKKLNKSELRIKELENQVATLQITCDKLLRDKEEVIRRNVNLVVLLNRAVKEISAALFNITNDLGRIN